MDARCWRRWTSGLAIAAIVAILNGCSDRGTSPPAGPSSRTAPGLSVSGAAGIATASFPGRNAVIAFPPRNESYDFRLLLEDKYRYGLGRSPGSTYVDVEGDIVWTQEYLRYRVNQCSHAEAIARVLAQIDGAGVQPVCGQAPGGQVLFPPRNEPYDFRLVLEGKYRDGLHRSPTATYVDIEGSIVWTQEYLRYRVNYCSHDEATERVFAQIDGQGIQPDCTPVSESNLTGVWHGTGTYPNAPFQMTLVQTGTSLRGQYADMLDRSLALTGSFTAPTIDVVVDFGDAKLNFHGTVEDTHTIRGTMWTSALGNRPYPFTMTR